MSAVAPLTKEEASIRLASLKQGPWYGRGAKAREKLASHSIDWSANLSAPHVDLGSMSYSGSDVKLAEQLTVTLTPHWKKIPSPSARIIRDSFDDALTHLQLIELAIETGYLDEESVRDSAREGLSQLLWSEPARAFIEVYDYVAIGQLAARVGLTGMLATVVPATNQKCEVFFAAFLTTQRSIEADPECEQWLGFLDDYVIRRGEQDDFYEFLMSGKPAQTRRRQELIEGARQYAQMLGDFLDMVPDSLRARFGAFHAYWLAKLFGYERQSRGYVRNTTHWGRKGDCWAVALSHWLGEQREPGFEWARKLFDDSVATLNATWMQLIEERHGAAVSRKSERARST